MTRALAALLAAATLASAGCDAREETFARYPGFAEYFATHPRPTGTPSLEERALLERHRPRVHLPRGHEGPVDFYGDYVAYGRLTDGREAVVSTRVTPEVLNAYRDDPGAVFTHRRPAGAPAPTPTVYGRIDRDTAFGEPLTFLTYHLVFRRSGLPAGMSWWQRWPLAAVGSADDWHQLDHYTAVVIALGRDLAPVAVTFQQHNYLRTYVVNDGLAMPRDGRLEVDVAIGSNELYPHRAGRQKRRAVSFMTADSLGYLITGRDRPMVAADDVTEPAVEIDYRLAYLPPADAFYSFQGRLGERRSLPGRDGPPGADYNTLPALKPMATQMLAFFWREADPGDLSRMRPILAAGGPYERLAEVQAAAFREALARARGHAGGR